MPTLKELEAAERRIQKRDRSMNYKPLEDNYSETSNPDSICRDGELLEDPTLGWKD